MGVVAKGINKLTTVSLENDIIYPGKGSQSTGV